MDPIFAKAYNLLFSNEPDSAEQLRAMLDEALKQKYGNNKSLTSVIPKKLMSEETLASGSTEESQVSPSPGQDTQLATEEQESEESNQSHDNDDELTLDLLEEDLTCVVCRQMGVVARNRLVECLECHSLYHQECHQPPIADEDVNDTRLAWYCATCKKNMNKAISTIKSTKPTATLTTDIPKSTVPSSGKPPFTSTKTFTKSNTSYKSSGSGNTKVTKHSKAGSPSINIISADRRLQMMKRRAASANKTQDKVKHTKYL